MKYLFLLLVYVTITTSLSAQANATALIPHYLYQFAHNIEKKNTASTYNIHIISKNKQLKREFETILLSKKVRGEKFRITQGSTYSLPASTNMLYFDATTGLSFSQLSSTVEGKPILLVSFKQSDKKRVMINLYVTDDKRLSFEINRANILNEGFSISDKVVLMGGTELDVAKLFKGAKTSLYKKELQLKKEQDKLSALSKKTKLLQEQYTSKAQTLKATRKALKKIYANLEKEKKNLQKTKNDLQKKKKSFQLQTLKNQKLVDELNANNTLHLQTQKALQETQVLIEEKNAYILDRQNSLKDLNQKILNKEEKLLQLTQVTNVQKGTIHTQRNVLILLFGAMALFIVLVTLILSMYRKQRRVSHALTDTLKELEETQEELVQSAKMASLGEMVSGLAHEMNTPIGVAITGISVLQSTRSELEEKLKESRLKESDLVSFFSLIDELSKSIDTSLQKAAQLVRSFKMVSVDQQVEVLREFNLSEYLSTILVSLKPKFKHSNIQVNIDIKKHIVLNSYPGIYYQIITNLINNSMLHGFEETNSGTIFIQAQVSESRLHLLYKDDGRGVSEKNISHIFEPFFTTKRANGGTGLGLHIIYNLITQKLQGSIKAQSIEGEGLTLQMNFPLELHTTIQKEKYENI